MCALWRNAVLFGYELCVLKKNAVKRDSPPAAGLTANQLALPPFVKGAWCIDIVRLTQIVGQAKCYETCAAPQVIPLAALVVPSYDHRRNRDLFIVSEQINSYSAVDGRTVGKLVYKLDPRSIENVRQLVMSRRPVDEVAVVAGGQPMEEGVLDGPLAVPPLGM
jgi:hypothetical protein